jgi:uncharacterized protein (DUF1684 family)
MKLKTFWTAVFFFAFFTTSLGQSSFLTETQQWRAKREAELKTEDSWLTVAGLFWLKEGLTTIGTDASAVDVVLPAGSAPGQIGSLELANGTVTLKVKDNVVVTVKDKPVREFVMKFGDVNKSSETFQVGTLKLSVIKRANRYGLRVRDKNSPQRLAFKGLHWFPARSSYRVVATFVAYPEPREMKIMNVLGDELTEKVPGTLTFTLNGKKFELRPIVEDEKKLFIIFKDSTAGETTYPAGRYLYADLPKDGKVVLDFNRAENPPCAFTKYATCPLPPRQNIMKIAINAGEMKYK